MVGLAKRMAPCKTFDSVKLIAINVSVDVFFRVFDHL